MIDLLIFSKDRACQAQLLLDSIVTYCPKNFFNITLLYRATTQEYMSGYDLLRSRYPDIFYLQQTDFYTNVVQWVMDSKNLLICFAVDDDVFYRDIKHECQISRLDKDTLASNQVFSFRLGFNTIVQTHTQGIYQPPLCKYYESDYFLVWNPNDYLRFNNYGYPMSVDMHIFNKTFIKVIFIQDSFNNPTSLEGMLTKYDSCINQIASFKKSAIVNIPCNNTGGCTEVNSTVISCETLNNLYLNGKVLDLSAISKHDIIGCHQDIPLSLKDFKENG